VAGLAKSLVGNDTLDSGRKRQLCRAVYHVLRLGPSP
jgi:hypothetical protein